MTQPGDRPGRRLADPRRLVAFGTVAALAAALGLGGLLLTTIAQNRRAVKKVERDAAIASLRDAILEEPW
ncbi:MAG TPA: hypothetical protein VNF50_08420 [Acidimicrobiales bacterium]|nr:hypothetical protein [Acidimicrobiales bacterium]